MLEWKTYGPEDLPLIREPLKQTPNGGCTFAALGRCIDYLLRLEYVKAFPRPIFLVDHELVDHEKLRENCKLAGVEHVVSALLKYDETSGVPLWNARNHKITASEDYIFAEDHPPPRGFVHKMGKWEKRDRLRSLLGNGPLLGTMVIRKDYSSKNTEVYIGEGKTTCGYHTVVILGLKHLFAQEAAAFSCIPGLYFIYQDSQGPENDGLLGMGRNLAHIDVLLKAYKVSVSLPSELCGLI